MKKIKNLAYLTVLAFFIGNMTGCKNLKRIKQENLDNLYPPENTLVIYHSAWTKEHYRERIKEFKKAPLHVGDIVFIGDSNTEYANNWSSKLDDSKVKNRGIAGDVTDGVLKRLDEITYFRPTAVFILIGTNDLFNLYFQQQIPSVEYVANNILNIAGIIHTRSPQTKIYVQTILPTDKNFLNQIINQTNEIIKLAEKEKMFEVIDLNTSFLDETGSLRKELTYDGTHLNKAGYAVWATLIKPYVDSN